MSNTGESAHTVCRGVRGAISVEANTRDAIFEATADLLRAIVEANGMAQDDIASVFFTATHDLTAAYPALAARERLGWHDVPLLCGQEMAVEGSMARCLRVLIHWNTARTPPEIRHIYLRDAAALRPDRAPQPTD